MSPAPVLDDAAVVVTWIDGLEETYHGSTRLSDGVLHVYDHQQTYHIPLANVRFWTKPS